LRYNHNYDKGAENVFGFADGDESWEVLNNNTNLALFKSADMTSPYTDSDGNVHQNWDRSFEGRYPDGNEDVTELSRFVTWVNSTDQAAATGDALPEAVTYEGMTFTSDTAAYRLAKFKSEIDQYCERRAMEFYYLFTEIFLMIDSRAKNAFWSAFMSAGGKWFSLPYDFDTAIGINNEGALAYGYSLEDGDSYKGSYVFNGQPSVLWVNLRQAFAGEIKNMYETLRAGNLSYTEIERRFEEHQSKWPEAIFNEDAYFKYLEPLITDGDAMYLEMLQGSKEQQRKWWLFNRFQYMDSKYQCGDASRATNRITLRAWAKAPITITPYSDIYCTVNWANGTIESVRGERNHSYIMQCPIDSLNDTEVYIYSASQLASVGDLSGLMLRLANFSYATKLQDIKVGDADENYDNPHLTDLSFANNTLLQSLDVRNCSGLSTAIDISQCINIEEVYFDGTNIGGLVLPVGGVLRILHLPESITNLTIRKQKKITDLTVAGYDNITTLWIDDCNQEVWDHVPDILDAMTAGSRVRLIGMHVNLDTYAEIKALMDTLDTFGGMDEAGGNLPNAMQSISGSIHAEALTGAQIVELEARYPNVDVTADSIESFVYFYNGETLLDTVEVLTVNGVSGDATYTGTTPTKASTEHEDYGFIGWSLGQNDNTVDADALLSVGTDRNVYACFEVTHTRATVNFYNGTTLLRSQTVLDGADATYGGSTPTRAATAANTFTFSGWSLGLDDNTVDSDALTAVTADRDVYACYTITGRTYTVRFYNGSTLLQTSTGIPYGGNAIYTGTTPVDPDDSELPFEGWSPEPTNIQGDTSCYAQFDVGEVRFQFVVNVSAGNTFGLYTTKARKIDWGEKEPVYTGGTEIGTIQTTGWDGTSTSGYGNNLRGDVEGVSRWTVTKTGASNILLTFDSRTNTESWDYIGVFRTSQAPQSVTNTSQPSNAIFWGTGSQYKGKDIFIDEGSATVVLYSNSSGTNLGFSAVAKADVIVTYKDSITEITGTSMQTTSHKYINSGEHTIGIYGRFTQVGIQAGTSYVVDIPMPLPSSVNDLYYFLYYATGITALPTGLFDEITSPITNIQFAFYDLPISHLDLSPLDFSMSSGYRGHCFHGEKLQTVKLGANGNLFNGSDFALTGYEYSGRILRDGVPYTLADAIALNDVSGTWSRGELISDLEIADTWDTIIGYINGGTAAQHYQIGQWKMLSVGSSSFMAQLVAFNADDLADGSGKAKTSWILRTSSIQHRFNPAYESGAVGTGTLGGWGESELRSYLAETILPTVQQSVKDAIKAVIKRTKIIDANGESQNNVETTDSIWIPSERELKGTGETQGADYAQFHSWAGFIRYYNSSTKVRHWLRTTSSTTSQKCVDAQGNVTTLASTNNSYVFIGFCL
jgi:hypothetical protein